MQVAIPVVVDLLLRRMAAKKEEELGGIVAIPVVVDLLLRPQLVAPLGTQSTSRNPCCSGPTASTVDFRDQSSVAKAVAIPVVVDLLLRHRAIQTISRS